MKKRFSPSILLILMLSATFFACEEDTEVPQTFGKLIGNISTEEGLPVSNAVVRISSPNFTETVGTSLTGNYTFERVPSGNIEISVNADSFIGVTESFPVKENIVNEKDFSLKLGEARLEVSTELIRATVVSGKSTLDITSNTSWTIINSASWISVNITESKGNQSVTINWQTHAGESDREAILEVKGGNISKMVKVLQPLPVKITEIKPFFGNTLLNKAQGFELAFSGPVTIDNIRYLFTGCLPEFIPFEYNAQKDRITYTYPCGRIGGQYPFLVEYSDESGNNYAVNFDVRFFDQVLKFEGIIQSRHTMVGQDKQWILTREPNKLYLIDLQKLEILKSFSLGDIRPWYLSHNPFNNHLYVATDDAKLLVINTGNGSLVQSIALPDVPYQENNKFFVNKMVFNMRGMALMEVYQTESSGISWFIMDSANGHKIEDHPDKGWDPGQFDNILYPNVSIDQRNIYFYGQGSENRGVIKMDEKAEKWSALLEIWDQPEPRNMIISRKDERFILDHGDIVVLDGGQRIDLGYIGYNNITADFCYTCPNPKTILFVGRGDHILDFYNYASGEALKRFGVGGGGQWVDILNTLDGKHMVVQTDNYDYDPQTGYYLAKMLSIGMERFE